MPQPKPPGDQVTIRGSLNMLFIVAMMHGKCMTPFLRDRIGSKAQGISMFVLAVLMVYFAVLTADEPFLYFCVAWLIAVVRQRASSASVRKQYQVHSYYSGRPWVAELLGCKEDMARLVAEPLICFATGWFLSHWSMNLGKFVGAAGVSLMLVELISRRINEQQEQAVIDAWNESAELDRRVRDRLGF